MYYSSDYITKMARFLLKRFLDSLWVLFLLGTLTFFMARFVPGGPFDQECNLSKTTLRNLAQFYGYDKPLYQQYTDYFLHLLHGDFGPSMRYAGHSVNQLLHECIPVSLELGFWAMLVSLLLGGTCGIICAVYRGSCLDKFLMFLCLFCLSLPTFVLGPIVIKLFVLKLNYGQAIGWDHWSSRILPVVTLACMYSGYVARLMRTSCIDTLNQPFVKTAYAKGLNRFQVLFFHVLKNAITPVLTYIGPATAAIMSGSLVIESLFQIPGAGSLFIAAVTQRDTALLLGTVLYFSFLILLMNFLVDVAVGICNPKQRLKF